MFVQKIRKMNPCAVLGLGQDSRARKIRIERKAVNLKKDADEASATLIAADGPEALFCTTYPQNIDGTTITYDAGQYVCNFSMYTCLEYCIPNEVDYMFLHVPTAINPKQAAKTIRPIIHHLRKAVLLK
jgi:pyrrolidone-carboxylate peptidase